MAEALEVNGLGSFSRGTHACGRVFLDNSAFVLYCCRRVVIRACEQDTHVNNLNHKTLCTPFSGQSKLAMIKKQTNNF